jgi:hypothetical protein
MVLHISFGTDILIRLETARSKSGSSYISLPWWCGQAVFGELDRPVYFIL